jgi:uncharacterized protein (DUF2345 family)
MADFTDKDAGSAVQPCPLAKKTATHWIEIRLVGEDDSPIPNIEYKVVLPNGDIARGFLDQSGSARVESIPTAGDCQVSFPGMDKDAWQRIA